MGLGETIQFDKSIIYLYKNRAEFYQMGFSKTIQVDNLLFIL